VSLASVTPALDVEDLHVTFRGAGGDVHALRGATLQIAPGEVVGLVGESGSGKSVLGLTALGLLPRDPTPVVTGTARLDGEDMVAGDEEARRARRGAYVGAVFQDPMTSLNPSMRVGRQVGEAVGGLGPEHVHELLAQTGIPEPEVKARAYPHQLSGGLRQRVMIAMALAHSPRLVVADEPTTALDVTVQARILALLGAAARERGIALLLVTHDLGVAARICDRIAVAYAGRIVETGRTGDVLHRARHPYTVGLLASRPRLDGDVAGGDLATLSGRPPDPRRPVSGCSFAARSPCRRTSSVRVATSATTPGSCVRGPRPGRERRVPTGACSARRHTHPPLPPPPSSCASSSASSPGPSAIRSRGRRSRCARSAGSASRSRRVARWRSWASPGPARRRCCG